MSSSARHDSIPCGADFGVDWGFQGDPFWVMTDKEGATWQAIGAMCETGRQAVIRHFHLEDVAEKLPLPVLTGLAPEILERMSSQNSKTA